MISDVFRTFEITKLCFLPHCDLRNLELEISFLPIALLSQLYRSLIKVGLKISKTFQCIQKYCRSYHGTNQYIYRGYVLQPPSQFEIFHTRDGRPSSAPEAARGELKYSATVIFCHTKKFFWPNFDFEISTSKYKVFCPLFYSFRFTGLWSRSQSLQKLQSSNIIGVSKKLGQA